MRLRLLAVAVPGLLVACSSSSTSGLDATSLEDAGASATMDAEPTADAEPVDGGVAVCDPPAATEPGVVRTAFATLRGTERGATWAYLGVRYAAPPVGALRFAAPAAPACETTIRDASAFGAICPQLDRQGSYAGDEDCLFLNVWAPAEVSGAPRPVMFFIHGGGNNQGASSVSVGTQPVYDGRGLAELGNVVVTINYRLGALGFLTHPAFDAVSPDGTSGNWGLRDQIAALEWVRDNIAAFGGDLTRVMIFGESAGGLNSCLLYVSPRARGLFSRALIESGGCGAPPKTVGAGAATDLAEAIGCGSASDLVGCLRGKTSEEIIAALPAEVTGLTAPAFAPVQDGVVITRSIAESFSTGDHANVPFILGTNEDETYNMLPPSAQVTTEAELQRLATAFLTTAGAPPAKIQDILAVYPVADYGGDPHAALVALTTDWRWGCAGRFVLRTLATTATAPLRRYYFTHSLDPTAAPNQSRAGAYHSLELFYVFGSVSGVPAYRPSAADLELSARMMRYWSRFAATGDPNATEDPTWPAWDAADSYVRLDVPTEAGAGVRAQQCDALEAILR